jgi:hypothetical protein
MSKYKWIRICEIFFYSWNHNPAQGIKQKEKYVPYNTNKLYICI